MMVVSVEDRAAEREAQSVKPVNWPWLTQDEDGDGCQIAKRAQMRIALLRQWWRMREGDANSPDMTELPH